MGEVGQLGLRHAVFAGGGQRIAVHAPRVRLGADVAGVERRAERLQRRPVRRLQLAIGGGQVVGGLLDAALQHGLVLPALDEQLPALQRAIGGDEQLVDVDGLHDEVVGAELEALDGRLDVGGAGEDDHGGVLIDLAHLLEQLDAGHVRHLQIGDGERGVGAAEHRHALPPVGGQATVVARRQKDLVEHLTDLLVIVDDQDVASDLHARGLAAATASPRPGSSRPVWPCTAPRRRPGTGPRRYPPRRPAGWPPRSWR